MKIIAFYLPQFHSIPENDEWWGKGFTEWVNVKRAGCLVRGQRQPRVPLNNNYYDLSDSRTMDWQIGLAKEYGVYGFCFYHYWLNGKLLLEKPVEAFLNDKSKDMPFCISWANHSWTNAWVSKTPTMLLKQTYGDEEEWKAHFEYLLPYLSDSRYIKHNGKPLLIIYDPNDIPNLKERLEYINKLAVEHGLGGITFAYQSLSYQLSRKNNDPFTCGVEYQPQYVRGLRAQRKFALLRKIKRSVFRFIRRISGVQLRTDAMNSLSTISYDDVWNDVINMKPLCEGNIPGAFVDWDNTPRRGTGGSLVTDATPEKFETYLKKQIERARNVYHSDKIFLFAWNEWAEGGYIEPDEAFEYGNLQAIKNALIATGEFPDFE